MKKTAFIINVFIMTGSMLIIRLAGMISNIYISAKAGAEAMGLYHVIFSVYAFAITVSVSGTGLAATRLVSEGKVKRGGRGKKVSFFGGGDVCRRRRGDVFCRRQNIARLDMRRPKCGCS